MRKVFMVLTARLSVLTTFGEKKGHASLFFYFLVFLSLTVHAQEFGMRWLYCAQAEETQQVWFKRSIHMSEPVKEAVLSVASEGRYIVFVNGYNISTDLFSANLRNAIAVRNYHIENFLNEGTNTIAVWYSPVGYTRRQLYATLQGKWENGKPFFFSNDNGWTSHPANARTLPDGREEIDGANYMSDWKDYDWKENSFLMSDWKSAELATGLQPAVITFCHKDEPGFRMQRVLKRAIVCQRGNTLVYDFGQPVSGWVRVTMRGMKKGDVVEVNGLRYVCKGSSDEQACRRFTTGNAGAAYITLPAGRSRSNITRVEAVSISEQQK